jgi:hypothetical protein
VIVAFISDADYPSNKSCEMSYNRRQMHKIEKQCFSVRNHLFHNMSEQGVCKEFDVSQDTFNRWKEAYFEENEPSYLIGIFRNRISGLMLEIKRLRALNEIMQDQLEEFNSSDFDKLLGT